MSLARVLDLCNAVVTAIQTAWNPTGPDAVSRVYAPDVGLSPDETDTLISGRQVYVFPAAYGSPGLATRSELWRRHTIAVLVVERYTAAAGAPTTAWIDDRVAFVEQQIFNLLRDPTLELAGSVVTQAFPIPDEEAGRVDPVYDLETLIEHRTFWSQATFEFQELTTTAGA